MIIYCKINKPGYERIITLYKGYKLIKQFENFYQIKSDLEFGIWIDKKYFFTNKELRKIKLKKLNYELGNNCR